MKVISADYTPIVPYETDILYIQSGQRYNVIVEMNQVRPYHDLFEHKLIVNSPMEPISYEQLPRLVVVFSP
jgi:FtsP/CotA-like multicopper oxidase with cupredoxin domain